MVNSTNPATIGRRKLLTLSACAIVAAPAPAIAAPAAAVTRDDPQAMLATDPIYAAIEAHRKANAEFRRVLSILPDGISPDEDAEDAASDVEREAINALTSTVPTTLAGVVAVLDHVNGYYRAERPDMFLDEDDMLAMLATIEESLRTLAVS